jgi:CRP/FNR family cyclic AMP-dependent transcriptional regulator
MATTPDIDLGSIWLFSACSATQLRAVRRSVREVEVQQDTILVAEGAAGDDFSYIVEGTAAVRRGGRVVARLGPGSYFGELSLLDGRPRSATVVSTSPMRLLVLDRKRFESLLDSTPALAAKLLRAMAGRLRQADARAFG